jgi:NADH-quinone oxidoreductase subunit I
VSGYFIDIFRGAASLISGFSVTLRALFSPAVTVQYPRQKLPPAAGFRGHPVLAVEQETGRPKCIACGTCARACPSGCIQVEGRKQEGEKRKYPALFVLDFTRCSLCGTCVEVCPVAALAYSKNYGAAGFTREAFVLDLLGQPGERP